MEDNLLEAYFKAYLMVLLMFKHAFVCLVFCLATHHPPPPLCCRPLTSPRRNQCPMFILSTSSAPDPIPPTLRPTPPTILCPMSRLLLFFSIFPSFPLPSFFFFYSRRCGFFSCVYFITIIPHFCFYEFLI